MRILILGSGPFKIVDKEGKNRRTNSSILIEKGDLSLLVDCTPYLIEQLEKNHVEKIDGLLITHAHRDAIGGIPQLREWLKEKNISQIPIFVERQSWEKIKEEFKQLDHLDAYIIKQAGRYNILGFKVQTVRVPHSIQPGFPTLAFRIDDELVYAEDIGEITKEAEELFKNAEILILDGAMWFGRQIKGHLSVDKTIMEAKRLEAKNLFIIQAGHTYPPYDQAVKEINSFWSNVKKDSKMEIFLTYDGLEFDTSEMFELFTYIGSKRNQMEFITSEIPHWVKTIFDPMAGSSIILNEMKSRGCRVIANDISPMAYYWSKAILGSSPMLDSDLKELMTSKPVEGWLAKADILRPTRKEARMYIDGLCERALSFEGRKRDLALGALSSLLTRMQGSLGIFKKEFEPYSIRMIKRFLVAAVKNMNSMITADGIAEVTMKDASLMEVPKVDLIYFDPPYDMKGAEEVPYGPHYAILNSVLMQKTYKLPDFPRSEIPNLIKKFCENSKMLLVSTSSSPTVDYDKLLKESGKSVSVKKFRRRTGGAAPKAKKDQTDFLWIASSYKKMGEPELLFESKEGIYLPDPHAKLIWEGKKSLIIKARNYHDMVGRMLYVIDMGNAYAVIRLHKPQIINRSDFEKLREYHCVTEEERAKWWGNRQQLFAYKFDIIHKYDEPKKIEHIPGTQTFVKNVKFLSHMEMVKDVSSYDPRQVPTDVLKDDWRIAMAWWTTKKTGGELKHSIEDIINLAKLIHDELKKRDITFHPDKMTPLSRELYNIVSGEKIQEDMSEVTEPLERMMPMLEEFKNFSIIKDFMSIVGSTVKHEKGHYPNDIDIQVRMREPSDYVRRAVEVRLLKMIPEDLGEKLHFIWGEAEGSHDSFVPLYDLALVRTDPKVVNMQDTTTAANIPVQETVWGIPKKKKDEDEVEIIEMKEVKLMSPFKPLKPSGKYGTSLFYDFDDLISHIKPTVEKKYFVEEKLDGFRACIHKKGKEVKIFSDQGKDITEAFPTIVEQAKEISDKNFIFDGELVPYNEKGESLGRRALMKFVGAIESGKKLDDSNIKFEAFDIIYFNDKPVNELKLYERKKIMETLKFSKNIRNVPSLEVSNEDDFKKAVNMMKGLSKSEGAMIKEYESLYPISGTTDNWIKFRKVRDIHVKVLDVHPVKGTANVWNYECGILIPDNMLDKIDQRYVVKQDGNYMTFGNTFNTSISASSGDIIDVDVQEIWRHEGKHGTRYSWHKPTVRFKSEKKDTSTFDDLDAIVDSIGFLVKEMQDENDGDWDDDEGTEEELAEDEEGGTRSVAATKFWSENWWKMFPKSGEGKFVYDHHWRGLTEEESKLNESELLNTTHSVHGDLRLQSDDTTLYGFTVFLGRTKDLKGGRDLTSLPSDDKLQGAWKLPQPVSWLKYEGVTEPSGPGATEKKYAKFFINDNGSYKIGVWREHAFEFFFDGGKMKGRYIITYAPVADGRRVWLISKPENQRPYSETHNKEDVIKELKAKGQKYLVWPSDSKPELIEI